MQVTGQSCELAYMGEAVQKGKNLVRKYHGNAVVERSGIHLMVKN
jgi:hypothetical protein